MTVVVLEEAADDLKAGRRFYESRERGVGDYFVESLLSDLASLVLYAGIHHRHFGLHRMLSKRFRSGSTMILRAIPLAFMPSWTYGEIRSGCGQS